MPESTRMCKILMTALLWAVAAMGADVTGNWKATAEGPMGSMERTFTFKQEGTKVTGETVSSMFGKSEIIDGKVVGDTLSFTIVVKFEDNEMKVNYKGKVAEKEMKLTAEVPMGDQKIEWVAKRVQ